MVHEHKKRYIMLCNHNLLLGKILFSIKTFALTEAILGLLVLLYPFIWCYTTLGEDPQYLFWVEVVFGVIIFIVAALALMTKSS
jgi:uncharacterized membrane protein